MMEDQDQSLEQDVSASEGSSPSPESNQPLQAAVAPEAPKEPPFHEHPRFKEVIEAKNSLTQRLQESERRFQEMSRRLEQLSSRPQQQQSAEENKLIARLKGIDPEFGKWAEQQEMTKTELTQLREWKSQMEAQNVQSQATSAIDKLHAEHKTPEGLKEFYNNAIRGMAAQNPHLSLSDLPSVYRSIHDSMTKHMETSQREKVASYAKAKTADAAIPSNPRGPSPKQGTTKTEYSTNPQDARAQIVAKAMKGYRVNAGS